MSWKDLDMDTTMDGILDYAIKAQIAADKNMKIDIGALCITQALLHLSNNLRHMTYRLGTADAATPMGALEAVAGSLEKIADAITISGNSTFE